MFKTSGDQYVGRINAFRVYSGSFGSDTTLETNRGDKAKMTNLFAMQGKDHSDSFTKSRSATSRPSPNSITSEPATRCVPPGATLRSSRS